MNAAELKSQLTELVQGYPRSQAALVPAMHLLRDQGVSTTDETLSVVAEVCGVEPRQVAELLSYYSISQNRAQAHASLCLGLICYLHGAKKIFDALEAEPCNGGTEHVKVSPCLGYCHAAPVMALADGTICKVTKSN